MAAVADGPADVVAASVPEGAAHTVLCCVGLDDMMCQIE